MTKPTKSQRELSEKLCLLGCRLAQMADGDMALLGMAKELHELSDENYSPGSVTWSDIKKAVPTKRKFYNSDNKEMPF